MSDFVPAQSLRFMHTWTLRTLRMSFVEDHRLGIDDTDVFFTAQVEAIDTELTARHQPICSQSIDGGPCVVKDGSVALAVGACVSCLRREFFER